jgi:fimbrial isopeptide formation D2 family protein/LPXTG-motif cell wall-anchored protein
MTMKKFKKKIFAWIAVLALAAITPMSAFATTVPSTDATSAKADNSSTSTIKVKTGNSGDTIYLYKAVKISIGSTNELSYEFTDAFKAFLKTTTDFKSLKPDDLVEYEPDSASLKKLMGEFSAYVADSSHSVSPDFTQETDSDGIATFASTPLGQYIVLGGGNTKRAKIYQTVTATVAPYVNGNVFYIYNSYLVEMKTSDPTIEKTASTTAGTVGKKITFTISATVPTFPDGATNTTFYMKDTPSAGLTIDRTTVAVKDREGNALSTDAYTVSYKDGTMYIDFVYSKLKAASLPRVVVTYDAVLNEHAVIGNDPANPNTASLHYANDPYSGSTYDPSGTTPHPDDSTGYGSVSSTVKIYTYGIVINKFDKNKHETKLANATFAIYDNAGCTGDPIATVTTDSSGYAAFSGLHAGIYYLKETVAPAGYKLLTTAREVNVTDTSGTESFTKTTTTTYTTDSSKALYGVQATDADGKLLWFATANDKTPIAADETTATAGSYLKAYVETVTTTVTAAESGTSGAAGYTLVEVENVEGKNLPGTGGIGIVPFIVVGSVLMIGAAVLLVTRRRMKDAE